jgi:hypothetical protein
MRIIRDDGIAAPSELQSGRNCVRHSELARFPSTFTLACLSLQLAPGGTMIRLKPGQRRVLVTHLPELANVAGGSLLFGQFLSERPYSLLLAFVGVAAWAILIGWVFVLAAGEKP